MRASHFHWRNSCAAVAAGVTFAGLASSSVAQVGAPVANPPAPPATAAPATGSPAQPGSQGGLLPAFPALAAQQANANAPAWIIIPSADIGLTATDNVGYSFDNAQADLLTWLTAGVSISGDTPRLQLGLIYNAFVSRALNTRGQDYIAHYGNAVAHTTIIPDVLFLDVNGSANQFTRDGLGVTNIALLDRSQALQTYVLSVAPEFKTRFGDFATLDLAYSYSRLWIGENTGQVLLPSFALGPVSPAEQQTARALLDMPGSFSARLRTTAALNGSSLSSGFGLGTLRRASGILINEYQVTRSIAAIAAGGYERLSNKAIARLNGEGAVWDIGTRLRPNVDSSIVLLYGRHDLNTDFAGEVQWRLSPLTTFYAAYTDSISSAQGSAIGSNLGTTLDENGPSVGVTFEDDPIIPLLAGGGLGLGAGTPVAGASLGMPGSGSNGPFYNDYYQLKSLRANLLHDFSGQPVNLTVYHYDQESLTGNPLGQITSNGAQLTWTPPITEDIVGAVNLGYQSSNLDTGYNLALSASYSFTSTMAASARYDFIGRKYRGNGQHAIVNAITLQLHKSFE